MLFYAKALSIISLFLLKLIVNAPKAIFKTLKKTLNLVENKIASSFKNIDTKRKLAKFRLLLSLKAFRRKLSRKKKRLDKYERAKLKEIEKNAVSVYPKPRHLRIKFKYFILGFLICILFVLTPISTYFFLNSLPSPKQLANRQIPQTTKIYDRNGKLLYQIYANENRTLVPISSIPKSLINATIAIEDKDFYTNPGFDIQGITRAAIADLSGKPIQGGSTITQQLIKSTLLTPERTIERKFKEIVLAFWAEKIYSKDEILEMYFNQVAYGGTAWGVESAAQSYFGKSVKSLTLAQSAFLAGMPQAPSDYSPFGENPSLWKKRQRDVLNKMVSLNFITKREAQEALNELLVFETPQTPIYAPHFVMYVKDLLIKKYGLTMVEKGGLIVTTSLDLKTQDMAQEIVRTEVDENAYLNLTNGAALVTNPKNGDVLAMVGSRDYNDPNGGNVNLTTSLRQPGSSIKLITYAAALSNGFTAATTLEDSPVTYRVAGAPDYSPVNYDGAFHGRIPLRIAFANSFNIPAVKTLAKIGIPTMIATARKMGITTWNDPQNYGLSITLGAAEVKMTDMATAYGTAANLGLRVDVNPILKITNYSGELLYQKESEKRQVLDSGVAYIISSILSDNSARSWEFGSNSPLNIPRHTVSVKTGTTDNKRDNWTIGYTPSYLVAVWVGNNDNSPMSKDLASGITGAAPIWNKIMTTLLGNVNTLSYKMPDNVVLKKCGAKTEYFIKGTETNIRCSQIATPSGMLVQPL
ncbi:MAG: 1A family penicillin-binding protein [Microgenomates group bacterium Gr01-1014_93]|nr:MAG: 1A family penicillin-binding protein [Microgenomates group bacterium Gr01-1014_93]